MKPHLLAILVLGLLLLSGCATSGWITDRSILAHKENPTELIAFLGPPAKIDFDQQLRLHKGEVQEYRYFVKDSHGNITYREYFYDNDKYLTSMSSECSEPLIKVIDPRLRQYQNRLEAIYICEPYLRP